MEPHTTVSQPQVDAEDFVVLALCQRDTLEDPTISAE